MLCGTYNSYGAKLATNRPISILQRPTKLKSINFAGNIAYTLNKKRTLPTVMMTARSFLEAYIVIRIRAHERLKYAIKALARTEAEDVVKSKESHNKVIFDTTYIKTLFSLVGYTLSEIMEEDLTPDFSLKYDLTLYLITEMTEREAIEDNVLYKIYSKITKFYAKARKQKE